MRFLVDESLPPVLARSLTDADFEATHLGDIGLRASSDDVIFAEAQRQGDVILSRDLDFSNADRWPIGTHAGLVVLRYSNEIRMRTIIEETVARLRQLDESDIKGNIVIIEPDRTRIRRKTS